MAVAPTTTAAPNPLSQVKTGSVSNFARFTKYCEEIGRL